MTTVVPTGAVALGSKLFFFKSESRSQDVLISAHGGYYRGNRPFTVPGAGSDVKVVFYAPHGMNLKDPGMSLMRWEFQQMEAFSSGDACVNYTLSKFQGRHGGRPGGPAETYQAISEAISNEESRIASKLALVARHQAAGDDNRAQNSQRDADSVRVMNIVTIRNRWHSKDVFLVDVVRLVRQHYPAVTTFHCSFCRSEVRDNNAETASAQMGKVA